MLESMAFLILASILALPQFYGQVSRRPKHEFSTFRMTFFKLSWGEIGDCRMASFPVATPLDPHPKVVQSSLWISGWAIKDLKLIL
jgi:hypothetical protein